MTRRVHTYAEQASSIISKLAPTFHAGRVKLLIRLGIITMLHAWHNSRHFFSILFFATPLKYHTSRQWAPQHTHTEPHTATHTQSHTQHHKHSYTLIISHTYTHKHTHHQSHAGHALYEAGNSGIPCAGYTGSANGMW